MEFLQYRNTLCICIYTNTVSKYILITVQSYNL